MTAAILQFHPREAVLSSPFFTADGYWTSTTFNDFARRPNGSGNRPATGTNGQGW